MAALLAVTTACGGDTDKGTSVQEFMESAGQEESVTVSDIYDRDVSEVVIIALHDGEVVESEVMLINVLYLCDMDLPYPATIDAESTLPVSSSSDVWSDGTRYPVAGMQ